MMHKMQLLILRQVKDLTAEVAERKSADTKLQKNINREANTVHKLTQY